MKKYIVQNRKGQSISVVLDESQDKKGLAFVMHGLGGFKEQDHIISFAEAFKEKGFSVVRFDTTNTLGESNGRYEDATVTNYYEDLEDVIFWAKKQEWFKKPFVLCGHSLGGLCVSLYAEKYPKEVLALAPVSAVVSGTLSVEAHKRNDWEKFKEWERKGWEEKESNSKPGVIKRLPWSHIEDRMKYDLIPQASNLVMPVLLIVGENDKSTPSDQVKIFFDALPGPKEFHIIKDAPHTFRHGKHLAEVKNLFLLWTDKILTV